MLIFILANFITSFGVAVLVNLDIVQTPAEGLSTAIDKKTKFSFSKIRFSMDIVVILFTIILSLIFSLPVLIRSLPVLIREGTIIASIIFNIGLTKFLKLLSIKNKKIIAENICIDCNSVSSNQI